MADFAATVPLSPSHLSGRDLARVGLGGLRSRKVRALLSGLGIAIGIASMVAVLGISASSKADLIAQLNKLGTNLLTVTPGQSFTGQQPELPATAAAMIRRIAPVEGASSVETISNRNVFATPYISTYDTNGIVVDATDVTLIHALAGTLKEGEFLTPATIHYPAVVLGAVTAQLLGIVTAGQGVRVFLGGHWFSVVGILNPLPLAPEIDTDALIGFPIAKDLFQADGNPTEIYIRTDPSTVDQVTNVLPETAYPQQPEEVTVNRPSDALAARADANNAFTSLFLGLGAIALLVGGIGIANIMVISVIERRSEIGLRRSLGATRRHIAIQFLTEALLLAGIGGLGGAVIGAAATAGYALNRGWAVAVPSYALFGGFGAALLIGALAGLYPALRAARLSPTEALRTV
jgi:putative ABC transport system permease protein